VIDQKFRADFGDAWQIVKLHHLSPKSSHSIAMPPKRHRPAHSEAAPAPFSSSSVSSFIPSSIRAINPHQISTAAHDLWKSYLDKTPNSLMIIDAFLIFLMYVGAVQFAYAVLTGGYPFNSFLAGFAAAVGQFVLAGTYSLIPFSLAKRIRS